MKININRRIFSALLLLCMAVVSTSVFAQSRTVTGVVTEKSGAFLTGVTVVVEGTQNGVVTDSKGQYTIKLNQQDASLNFSFVGYYDQKVAVGSEKVINVILEEQVTGLEEVVVVGYGTMKKKDLVGAVDQVGSELIEDRATSTLTRSLQGQIPNLNIAPFDGKPGRSASYNVRGTTSIGAGGSALILIDGVEGDPNNVNPQDVESVSVLKDASSAAIYGARGTFGVILITTKKAQKGGITVKYNGSFTVNKRTVEPDLVTDGLLWTDTFLESFVNNKGSLPASINNIFPYSTEWHEELRRHAENPELPSVQYNEDAGRWQYFGNTDWQKLIYKDFNTGTDHSVSVTGGNDNANFYVSGRYFSQEGIYNGANSDDFAKGNFRARGEINIKPWLSIDNNFDMAYQTYHYPVVSYDPNVTLLRNQEHQGYPVAEVFNPDGTFTETANYMGVANLYTATSYQDDVTTQYRNTVGLNLKPIQDVLNFRADLTYTNKIYARDRVQNYEYFSNTPGVMLERGKSQKTDTRSNTNYIAANVNGTWSPYLGENNTVKVTGGWNLETSSNDSYTYQRDGFLFEDRPNFDLMDGTNYNIGQNDQNWAYVGLFYRVNYAYKGKYLFETSGRYDGSSKFPINQMWGFFPSSSLAWRISEEQFMDFSKSWLNNLKVRASVGTLGNGNVSPYKFLSTMSVSKSGAIIGSGQVNYTSVPGLIPESLTWEKVTTYNLGVDLDMLDNRLSASFDTYRRNTTDMYTAGQTLPDVLGASSPKGNYADLKTLGWEATLSWRDRFELGDSDFSYGVKLMMWDSQSWVTRYNNDTGSINDYYEGYKIGDIWGYNIEGLFTSYDEIANHASQSIMKIADDKIWRPGDMKFKDNNNDGVINKGSQTLSDHGDLAIVGNSEARYQFGANLNANWKGFGVSVFLQGVGKKDWYPGQESALFWGQYNRSYSGYLPTAHLDRWTEENPDPNAYWPRLISYSSENGNRPFGTANDKFMQDASYLRVKTLTVDYTLPKKWLANSGISAVKVYFTGENLFTFSNISENFDPEIISGGDPDLATKGSEENGYSYPLLKNYTIGLNITF